MIETLHSLAEQSCMKKVIVSVEVQSEGQVSVSIQSVPNELKESASADNKKLRDILATPISISGLAGEVDAQIDQHLLKYVKTVKPFCAEIGDQIEAVERKAKAAKKKVTKKKVTKKKATKVNQSTAKSEASKTDEVIDEADIDSSSL